jgi:hypothetical protein
VMMRLPSELGPVGILALICTCAGVSSLFFFSSSFLPETSETRQGTPTTPDGLLSVMHGGGPTRWPCE